MKKSIVSKVKSLWKESAFAILSLVVFFSAMPWIRSLSPESGVVDAPGEFHVMLSGFMAYGCAFAMVAVTFYLCIRTLWNYAFNNDDKDDPNKEKASFREDWQMLSPWSRVAAFTWTFTVILALACYCLKT